MANPKSIKDVLYIWMLALTVPKILREIFYLGPVVMMPIISKYNNYYKVCGKFLAQGLTVFDILTFGKFDFLKMDQGSGMLLSQWRHSIAK